MINATIMASTIVAVCKPLLLSSNSWTLFRRLSNSASRAGSGVTGIMVDVKPASMLLVGAINTSVEDAGRSLEVT